MPSNKKILIALYHDYHLFGYYYDLIPIMLDQNYRVTVLTCDPQIVEKYSSFTSNPNFELKYSSFLGTIIRLMDKTYLRLFIWIYGWIICYLTVRHYDCVIVPRDSKPFQHMISAFSPAIVCQPGLSNDDKRYLHHKYAQILKFPVPEVRTKHPLIDKVFGGSYLRPIRGQNKDKNYTVTGEDFFEYYNKLGIPREHLKITGNPNYEGLADFSPTLENSDLLKEKYNLENTNHIYVYFSSKLHFNQTEINQLIQILTVIEADQRDAIFIIKAHPRMPKEEIEHLHTQIRTNTKISIHIISDLVGDKNNLLLIDMAKAILIEESNVGILAAWHQKPIFVISPYEQNQVNIYALFGGIDLIRSRDDMKTELSNMKNAKIRAQKIASQNEMVNKISKKILSPNKQIVNMLDSILTQSK